MKHEILLLGKIKDSFIAEGVNEYLSRLSHYTKVELKYLKAKGKRGAVLSIEQEGELLLANIPPNSYIVALDVKGEMFSSPELADKIGKLENIGTKSIIYLIGGPLGLSRSVLQKANLKLSFSKMTFTHDMIRLMLVEQVYRAYTIKAGEKYHK
ncbi:MAG: 23S rRNA (pseudouridine(1915)-N(3))-methyltransferase RlmH [Desulfotalea sp.]